MLNVLNSENKNLALECNFKNSKLFKNNAKPNQTKQKTHKLLFFEFYAT